MGDITRSIFGKVTKAYPLSTAGKVTSITGSANPQSAEAYLRYYKEISWLRAGISVIANGVAQSGWVVYRKKKNGDREEITQPHELKSLLTKPNPFQSGHDFFYMHQVFDELIGANYWKKEKDKGQNELWLLPPQYMTPIAHPKEFISGYKYERAGVVDIFKPEEIIMFLDPDPIDPRGGVGRAQSVGLDIENQSMMSQWNRNFFFWGADPGTIITYPIEASITPDELDRLNESWGAGHRAYGRAFKTAILTQGATVEKISMGQRDMDFTGLSKYNRESILGVFGVSYSMVGGTDNVIRANAEAQLYNFAKWVLTPRLIRIREKLNMFLCPDYGEDLEVDYVDPSPDNEQMDLDKATRAYQAGIMTKNEARAILKLDPTEDDSGETFYQASSGQGGGLGFYGLSPESLSVSGKSYTKGGEGHQGRPGQVGGSLPKDAPQNKKEERAQRAKESYKAADKEAQQKADESEAFLATTLKGKRTPDNSAFDLLLDGHVIEIKTIVRGGTDKITMHKKSLKRKWDYVSENAGVKPHTIVVDSRTHQIYYKADLGSFRLKNMTPVSVEDLRGIFGV